MVGNENSGRRPDVFKTIEAQKQNVIEMQGAKFELPNLSGVQKGVLKTAVGITANAFAYYNSSKVLTSSSDLAYDGTTATINKAINFTGTIGETDTNTNRVGIGVAVSPRLIFEITTGTQQIYELDNNGTYFRIFKPGQELVKVDTSGNLITTGALFITNMSDNSSTFYSGQYTPSLTNVANISSSTAYSCQFMKVGEVMHVSGRVTIDPTLAATSTKLGISLPSTQIVVDFASNESLAGTAFCPTIAGMGAGIKADTTNDIAQLEFISTDINSQDMYFTFTYYLEQGS